MLVLSESTVIPPGVVSVTAYPSWKRRVGSIVGVEIAVGEGEGIGGSVEVGIGVAVANDSAAWKLGVMEPAAVGARLAELNNAIVPAVKAINNRLPIKVCISPLRFIFLPSKLIL
jgi:hypothetical protein